MKNEEKNSKNMADDQTVGIFQERSKRGRGGGGGGDYDS